MTITYKHEDLALRSLYFHISSYHCYNEFYETDEYHSRLDDHSSREKKIDHDGNDLSFPDAEEAFAIKMTNQVAKR